MNNYELLRLSNFHVFLRLLKFKMESIEANITCSLLINIGPENLGWMKQDGDMWEIL